MARKVTYEDLERLLEGQFALAAKVNERQGSLTKIETILELGFRTSQSQQQVQAQEGSLEGSRVGLGCGSRYIRWSGIQS